MISIHLWISNMMDALPEILAFVKRVLLTDEP